MVIWSFSNYSFVKLSLENKIRETGTRNPVSNASGNRCESDCRSRGREFDPRSHTFMEIDREIISTVILLPSAESFKKSCCQLQAKVCARSTVNCLFKLAQEKVWLGELTVPP